MIASCLVLASSGCDGLSRNRTARSAPARIEFPAEGSLSPEASGNVSHDAPVADLVITNAKIVTIDRDNPRAEAVAFKGEIIIAVGSNDAVEKYAKEGISKIIDARGRLVVPGFNDAHIHFSSVDLDYIDLR